MFDVQHSIEEDEFDAIDALSRDVWSIELEEKIMEIERLKKEIATLESHVDRWIDSTFYWHRKFFELKRS